MFARTFVLAAAFAAVAAGSAPAFAAGPSDSDQLVAIDKRMQRAFVDRDVATLEKIITEDYVLVLPNGAERMRPEILADVASPDLRFEINESSAWEVRVHGDTGIVVALLHQKGTNKGQAFDHMVKFSDTYIRDHGVWRNVHAHASRIADPPKPGT
jgi:ketosteroid isomerase-like protein